MKTLKYFLTILFFLSCIGITSSQIKPLILSSKVGKTIDKNKNLKYEIFPVSIMFLISVHFIEHLMEKYLPWYIFL